jgi:hypothetical protein
MEVNRVAARRRSFRANVLLFQAPMTWRRWKVPVGWAAVVRDTERHHQERVFAPWHVPSRTVASSRAIGLSGAHSLEVPSVVTPAAD